MSSSLALFGGSLAVSWYLIAIAITWLVAQGVKYVVVAAKSGNWRDLRPLYASGDMPSVHSALVTSLLVVIAKLDGMDSAVFAVAVLLAVIVIYDSMMVRRSSGEQGGALKAFLREQGSKIIMPYVAKGHTATEVLAGVAIGLMVGLSVNFLA